MAWNWFNIPSPRVEDHFVYFLDLLDSKFQSSPAATVRKKQVGQQATNLYNDLLDKISIESAQTQIMDAIKFITSVAENERNKETIMLNNVQNKYALDITNFSPDDPFQYYKKLIDGINEKMLGLNEYQHRLAVMKNNVAHSAERSLQNYMQDDVRFRASGDLISGLKKLRRTYAGTEKQEFDSALNIIQTKALEIAIQRANGRKGASFAAFFSLIVYNLEQATRDIMEQLHLGNVEELHQQLREKLEEYDKHLDQQRNTELEKILFGDDQAALDQLLNNLITTYNIKDVTRGTKEYEKIVKQRKALLRGKQKSGRRSSLELLSKIKDQKLKNSLLYIDFTDYGTTGFGNLQEVAISALERGVTVGAKGSAADTVFALGQITVGTNQQILDNYFNDIENILTTNQYDYSKETRMQDYSNLILERNQSLETIYNGLNDELTKIQSDKNNIEKSFIIHDSIKLQSSAETAKLGGGFSGRTLSLISYIDELLAIAGTSEANITPIDRDSLIYLGMNCANLAVGKGSYDPLIRYFSIFAGMIMFDDTINMAKEMIAKTGLTDNSSLYQIHLYNLNGIYVPASYILQNISYGLEEVGQAMYAGDGASVTINSSKANKAINDWERPARLHLSHWRTMGDKVSSAVKIKITFLLSFIDFINRL